MDENPINVLYAELHLSNKRKLRVSEERRLKIEKNYQLSYLQDRRKEDSWVCMNPNITVHSEKAIIIY